MWINWWVRATESFDNSETCMTNTANSCSGVGAVVALRVVSVMVQVGERRSG